MADDYDYAIAQLDEYWKSIMTLAHLSPEERSREIDYLGRSLKELSKMTIPDLNEKDHDPFSGVFYSINTGQSQQDRDEYEKWYEEQKIKLLVEFCERKRSQIGMLKEKKKSLLESKNLVSSSSIVNNEAHHWWKESKYWIPIGVSVILSIVGWLVFGA